LGPNAANERPLLGSTPAFQLPLSSDSVDDAIEVLRPDELYRSPPVGIALERTSLMLGDPPGQIIARRGSHVEAIVGTPKYVNKSPH
jgi:hypothetical protein